MNLVIKFLRLLFSVVLVVIEGGFWIIHGLLWAIGIGKDVVKSRRSMDDGVLHCPRGHEVPLEGQVYECSACGYVYEGSFLRCPNPECQAQITSYINCPTCGLSVRNPYRFGKP